MTLSRGGNLELPKLETAVGINGIEIPGGVSLVLNVKNGGSGHGFGVPNVKIEVPDVVDPVPNRKTEVPHSVPAVSDVKIQVPDRFSEVSDVAIEVLHVKKMFRPPLIKKLHPFSEMQP